MYSGSFPSGIIREIPIIRKKRVKNIDWKNKYESKEPNTIIKIGAKNEKEVTPEGVIFRCAILMLSVIVFSFFLSGFILRIFSLKLHIFS